MASKASARSILKQRPNEQSPTLSAEQKAKVEQDRRNLGVALYHANKIQSQKDYQALILSNVEKLLEFPSGTSYTAKDKTDFVSLIAPFQPSDFASLIEERKIDGKCGYPLCSHVPRSASLGVSAAWKLKGQGAGDYCSNDCLRKSLYVKTQLSEVPAWEREPAQQPQIVLLGDDASQHGQRASSADTKAHLAGGNTRELALERGEQAGSFKPNQVMADSIVEKVNVRHSLSASSYGKPSSYASIEGYVPTQTPDRTSTSLSPPDANSADGTIDNDDLVDDLADDEDESWKMLYENVSIR